jgi:hypothetical protein
MPDTIRISVRAAPAAIAWHIPAIEQGAAFAEITVSASTFRYPDADAHDPSPSLRAWMTQSVRAAILRDRLKRWIIWPDASVTSFPGPDFMPHLRPAPSRHHGEEHA